MSTQAEILDTEQCIQAPEFCEKVFTRNESDCSEFSYLNMGHIENWDQRFACILKRNDQILIIVWEENTPK